MEFLYLSRQDRKGVIDVFRSDNDRVKERVRKKLAEHIINSLIMNNVPVWEIDDIFQAGQGLKDQIKKMRARREFRTRVIAKERHECKLCGKTNEKLTVHHIEPVEYCPELKWEVNNTILLCATCHQLMHNREYKNRVEYLLERTNFNKDELHTEFPYRPELEIIIGGK